MSIIRTKQTSKYTVVSNEILSEKNGLSWEAIGLLIYLLSKPDNWTVSPNALTKIGKCGSNKITSLLQELKTARYIIGKKRHTGQYDYFVYDTPQAIETATIPKPKQEKPKQEKPKQEKPKQEKPKQDFQAITRTELLTTTDLKTNIEKTTTTDAPSIEVELPTYRNIESKKLLPLLFLNEEQLIKATKQAQALSPEQLALAVGAYRAKANQGIEAFDKTPAAYWAGLVNLGKRNALSERKEVATFKPVYYESTRAKESAVAVEVINEHDQPMTDAQLKEALFEEQKSKAIFNTVINKPTPSSTNPAMSDKQYHTARLELIKTLISEPKRKEQFLAEFNDKGYVYSSLANGAICKEDLATAGLFD